jgi:chorismate mutase
VVKLNIVSIRGAITLKGNNKLEILNSTEELLSEIEKQNDLSKEKVISILFSATKDLNATYPAKAARDLGYTEASLMCFNEMEVIDSLEKCIRVMVLYKCNLEQKDVKHVYLREAKALRPDLNK